jgi:hypothetical protein
MSRRRRGEAQACGRSSSCCSRPRPPTVREPRRCRATTCPRPSRRGRRARGGSVGAAHRGPAPSAHPRHHLGIQRAPRGATRAIRRRTPRRLARAPRAGSRRPRDRRESDRGRSRPRRTTRGRPFEPPPAGAERAHRRRRGETGICRSVATASGQSSSASRRSASPSPARATTSKPAPASRREHRPRVKTASSPIITPTSSDLDPNGIRCEPALPATPEIVEPFRRRGESRRTSDDPRRDGDRYM